MIKQMDNNLEKRFVEIRASEDRTIKGTAIVFNSESKDLGFKEIILPEAINRDIINNNDIVMLYNHNEDEGILARSKNGKGSLKIDITNTGVDFSFTAKQTAKGDEILQSVRSGDLDACSFAFKVAEGGDSWEKRSDGSYLRTIKQFELLRDFSIVSNPAYEATSVRSFDEFKEKELKELKEMEERKLQEETLEKEKEEALNTYFNTLDEMIKEIKN
jgi:uncharacterized protein